MAKLDKTSPLFLYDSGNTVPENAHILIRLAAEHYNKSLAVFLRHHLNHILLLLTSGTMALWLKTLFCEQWTVFFAAWCLIEWLLIMIVLFDTSLDAAKHLFEMPAGAAFLDSFRGTKPVDLSLLDESGFMWQELCERHEKRVERYKSQEGPWPLDGLAHVMAIDGLSFLFTRKPY